MIHYNYIDPADAKPKDFMLISMRLHFDLSVCVSMPGYGNTWQFICQFERAKCSDEIIDGKPTPELIARFTGSGGKRFEINGKTLVKTVGGIALVGSIQPLTNQTGYYFEVESNGRESTYRFNEPYLSNINLKQAEAERARLIEWLEEA